MPLWTEIPLTLVGAMALWALGTVVFDAVHWILHALLRSRSPLLRGLAWPHSVHHAWLDRNLEIHPELQRRNIWCHLVPEYLTQVAFSAGTALLLPAQVVLTCVGLQSIVFVALLSYKGLDINHRAVAILDAYPPSAFALPAYHALHHVYPDAYFSAYSKVVDWLVGGGTQLAGRRFALLGAKTPFGNALQKALERESAASVVEIEREVPAVPRGIDVLAICDESIAESPWLEAFIAETRTRQLPPEVWAVHAEPENAVARHYYRDPRVQYRTVVLPRASSLATDQAERAANLALFFIRRGLHYVPTQTDLSARRQFLSFLAVSPERPAGVTGRRSRADLATAATA